MPDFTLPDLTGQDVALSKISAGKKVVMIDFWATWCGPCRMEMPGFEKLFTEHAKDGLLIVAVSEDEDRAALDKYLKEKHLSFPVLSDGNHAVASRFGVKAFP